jgi:hypothetical protein
MSLKQIQLNAEKTITFGRVRGNLGFHAIKFGDYLRLDVNNRLPKHPPNVDFTPKAIKGLDNVYLNDNIGDCTIAGPAHLINIFLANAKKDINIFSSQQILNLYSSITGYNPNDPKTDQGADLSTVLDYWRTKGFTSSHKIVGYLKINGADIDEVRAALYLFEGLYLGLELPDEYINPFPTNSGFVWDVAGDPDPDNGHCIVAGGYDTQTITIATWGLIGHMTNAAFTKYFSTQNNGEVYAVLTQDVLNKATKKNPDGLDWEQLQSDFKELN